MGQLREAFCEAVKLYCENDWSSAVPELPEVTIGKKHYPIRAVFELATELGDAHYPTTSSFAIWTIACGALKIATLEKGWARIRLTRLAASCMLELLNRRECKYQQQESRPNW